jgi:superfamily II DNA/RNA helicase
MEARDYRAEQDCMKFSDLGLGDDVLRAVEDAGYTEPTPIQIQAIPVVLMGRDVLGSAQTGTGKTAGFTLPMIEILASGRAKARMPRSLIVEPTRELAAQVAVNFETYGKYHNLSKALLTGGTSITEQQRLLDRGVDVLIATPGRLLDLFDRGKILLSDCKLLVIDEADRMLDMGFIPDVERIVTLLPKIRQTLFFSATMPPEIRRLADAFLMNPKEISVDPPATAATMVDDFLVMVPERDKSRALRRLLEEKKVDNALIFCNRKRDVDVLARTLKTHGFNVAPLHGDLPQIRRTETLASFKSGEIPILVASDVAARGLDISEMPCVINYDVPYHAEDYVHRIGRTGRAGRSGRAFTFGTSAERKQIASVEHLIGRPIPRISVDGFAEVQPASADESEARAPAEPGNGRRRRGGRSRPEKAAKPAEAVVDAGADCGADDAPDTPAEAAPTESAATPGSGGGRRRGRGGGGERGGQTERNERGGRGIRDERKPPKVPVDAPTTGMGDHMPAFLTRPARADGNES